MQEKRYSDHREAGIIDDQGEIRTFLGDPSVFAVRETGIIVTTSGAERLRMFVPWNRVAYLKAHQKDFAIWNELK